MPNHPQLLLHTAAAAAWAKPCCVHILTDWAITTNDWRCGRDQSTYLGLGGFLSQGIVVREPRNGVAPMSFIPMPPSTEYSKYAYPVFLPSASQNTSTSLLVSATSCVSLTLSSVESRTIVRYSAARTRSHFQLP